MENGTEEVGYQHVIKEHGTQLAEKEIVNERIGELAEAATKVGISAALQNPEKEKTGRPIFLLCFYERFIAVGVTVASNGFIVGMNFRSFREILSMTQFTEEAVKERASWPTEERGREERTDDEHGQEGVGVRVDRMLGGCLRISMRRHHVGI